MESLSDCKDMFDFITEKKVIEENLARNFFHQIVKTVLECHSKGVIHRDIKDDRFGYWKIEADRFWIWCHLQGRGLHRF